LPLLGFGQATLFRFSDVSQFSSRRFQMITSCSAVAQVWGSIRSLHVHTFRIAVSSSIMISVAYSRTVGSAGYSPTTSAVAAVLIGVVGALT
jgi:hypothetical protein